MRETKKREQIMALVLMLMLVMVPANVAKI